MNSFKNSYNSSKLQAIHASIHSDSESNDTYYPDSMEESIDNDNESVKKNFELSNKLTNHYGDLLKKTEHSKALQSYTVKSYSINNDLWNNHEKKGEFSPEFAAHSPGSAKTAYLAMKENTRPLDKALKDYKTPHELSVWSSSIHDPRIKKNSEGLMHHPAYLSTSIYKPVAMNRDINSKEDDSGDYHHHILKIHVPEGHPGAYVNHISSHPGEYEFLLPRGLNLKHIHTDHQKTTIYNYYKEKYATKHTYIHHMEIP